MKAIKSSELKIDTGSFYLFNQKSRKDKLLLSVKGVYIHDLFSYETGDVLCVVIPTIVTKAKRLYYKIESLIITESVIYPGSNHLIINAKRITSTEWRNASSNRK